MNVIYTCMPPNAILLAGPNFIGQERRFYKRNSLQRVQSHFMHPVSIALSAGNEKPPAIDVCYWRTLNETDLRATARCQLPPVSSNRLTVESIISYLQILDFLRRPVSPLRRSESTHALWPRNNFRFLYTFLLNCPSFTRLVAFLRVFITCCQFSLVRRPRNQL